MRNNLFKISALVLAAVFAFGGCTKVPADEPIDVTVPVETPVQEQAEEQPAVTEPEQGYSVISEEILLPQDVPEEEAVYRLSYTAPQFEALAANEAVLFYLDELYTHVTSERLPYADPVDSLPYTNVTFEILPAELPGGTYTNVVFTEEHSFGGADEAEYSRHVIVLGPDDEQHSLASVSGVYFPENMAAQQVLNVMAYEPDKYFGDITADSVLGALDLYNGFMVVDEGYTLLLPAGTVASEEKGPIEITFPRRALYPDFVGDIMTEEDYEAILPALSAAAAVWGPEFSGFSAPPTDVDAQNFMYSYLLLKGYSSVSPQDYTAAYKAVFGAEIPAPADTSLLGYDEPVTCGVQWEEATAEGDTVTLAGQLMSGLPGSSGAAPAASVTARLTKGAEGWLLTSFEVM